MIHSEPQPGDIGLTQIHGKVGRLIRVGQWLNGNGFADYQHAFLVLPDGQLLEAEPGGARVRPLDSYADTDVLYVCPPEYSPQHRADVCAAALKYVGVPYSFLDYLAIAAHRIHLNVPRLRHYVAATGHMICSQLVDRCFQDAGMRLFDDRRWPGYVTPLALYQRLAD